MKIPKEYIPLLKEALKHMNHYDFDYYFNTFPNKYKTKWDVIKYGSFKAFHSSYNEKGEIAFYPDRLEIKLPNTGWEPGFVIPIDECEKIFVNQSNGVVTQESLF